MFVPGAHKWAPFRFSESIKWMSGILRPIRASDVSREHEQLQGQLFPEPIMIAEFRPPLVLLARELNANGCSTPPDDFAIVQAHVTNDP